MSFVNKSADSKRMKNINHQIKSVTAKSLKKMEVVLSCGKLYILMLGFYDNDNIFLLLIYKSNKKI